MTHQLPTNESLVYPIETPVIGHDRVAAYGIGRPVEEAKTISAESIKSSAIMVVDDEPINVKIVRKYLKDDGYQVFLTTTDSTKAFSMIRCEQPDLVLLDIYMPEVSGLDILTQMSECKQLRNIPVLILTSATEEDMKLNALELGANDFLSKPVKANELKIRVRNMLLAKAHQDQLARLSVRLSFQVELQAADLKRLQEETIRCLARTAELRFDPKGLHTTRVGRYAAIIGRELGLDNDNVLLLQQAAQLHDIGKIGLDDSALRIRRLTSVDKWRGGQRILRHVVDSRNLDFREHTVMGAEILRKLSTPVMKMAAMIAATHHEKWDGSGYPHGLAGDQIPLEGRIAAVADVFDELSSPRSYKDAIPLDQCVSILEEGRGSYFEPQILDMFLQRKDEVADILQDDPCDEEASEKP